jgi:hypothetical protein
MDTDGHGFLRDTWMESPHVDFYWVGGVPGYGPNRTR